MYYTLLYYIYYIYTIYDIYIWNVICKVASISGH